MSVPSTFLILLVAIAAPALYWHLHSGGEDIRVDPEPAHIECDIQGADAAVEHLSRLLQFATVYNVSDEQMGEKFDAMIAYLASTYSDVWSAVQVEMVGAGSHTMLLTWKGSEPKLLPLLFISHYDVVPVTKGTEAEWTHGPFSGAIQDGYIWGRGSMDIKFSVIALLETMTTFIQQGFVPRRTIYMTFGQDEEVGGSQGASVVAGLLQQRGVRFELIVDEGGAIMIDGLKPLVQRPVALIGTSEKLYTMIQVSLTSPGGHSSMPPVDGSDVATQAAKLLLYIKANPFPAVMLKPFSDLLKTLSTYTDNVLLKYLLARCETWPVSWIILQAGIRSAELAAMIRTTVAVTRLSAGVADNVLPQQGAVLFNLRTHPLGTSREEALEYFNTAIRSTGISATASIVPGSFDGPTSFGVTDYEGRHFRAVKQAIQETWQSNGRAVAVAPMLMSGGTDSKHFSNLTQHGILRFTPYSFNKTAGDLGRIHGTNERIPVQDLKRSLCTYRRIIELLCEDLDA